MPRLIYDAGTGYACTLAELLDFIAGMTSEPQGGPALPTFGNLEPLAARIAADSKHVADAIRTHRQRQAADGFDGPDIAPRLIDGIDAVFEYVRELRRIVKAQAPSLNDALQDVWCGEAVIDEDGNITAKGSLR